MYVRTYLYSSFVRAVAGATSNLTIESLARRKSVHASPVKQLGFCLSTGCENKICKYIAFLSKLGFRINAHVDGLRFRMFHCLYSKLVSENDLVNNVKIF